MGAREPGRAAGSARPARSADPALQALAQDTIAAPELAAQIGFQMRLLIAQHDLLAAQIAEAEAHLATLLDGELVRRLRTIPGVGPAICTTLVAEIADIRRFSEFDKLVAYIGVHPAEKSSGEKGTAGAGSNDAVALGPTPVAEAALPHDASSSTTALN